MFERFTEQARRVVTLAQEESGLLRHNYIGTEHLLLGILRQGENVAARVLEGLGMTLEGARARVRELIGVGEDDLEDYADALRAIGIDLAEIERRIEAAFGPGALRSGRACGGRAGGVPFTPRAKKMLELSLRECLPLGHGAIGPEHVLLALTCLEDTVGAHLLEEMGGPLGLVRGRVIAELRRPA